jgi:large subunit ribosomal protein L9
MAVKIILREHVDHLGERGEIVNVAPGYARNFLLPKGLALMATPGNIRQIELRRKAWAITEAREVDEAEQFAARVGALSLAVTKKAGETGTLYGSVTTSEIAELLADKGIEVDRRKIVLAEPIKSVGEFEVAIKLHRKVQGKVKLKVEAEEAPATETVEEPARGSAQDEEDETASSGASAAE